MRWWKEMQTVGIADWVWFVAWLQRDEFSPKLSQIRYYPDMLRLYSDRQRAQRIQIALCDISGESG